MKNNQSNIKTFLIHFDFKNVKKQVIKYIDIGCIIQADNKGIMRQCKASAYNKNSEALSPRKIWALDTFPIVISTGEILVDANNNIKIKSLDKSQLT